ncbi:MAG: DUF779 domain-containing protein [Candidatus Sericytochromatia bacterium]
MAIERVTLTPATAEWLDKLRVQHGPLLFHQSGGCCDGSSPMCYPLNEFKIGSQDVLLGVIADCPFFISGPQYEYWKHTRLIIDVVKGRGSGFSVEAPEGIRFLTRSELFSDAENAAMEAEGDPPRGDAALALLAAR